VRASDFTHAIERVFELNSGGSPFYTDIVGAERFAETKRGGIPGIETNDRSGEIVIHLTERAAPSQRARLDVRRAAATSAAAEDLSAEPPPATGPYVITKSQPGRGWEYERNPQWQRNNGRLMPRIPGGHVDRIEVTVVRNPRPRSTTSNRAPTTGWRTTPADRLAAVQSKYEGTQFRPSRRSTPTTSG